MPLRHRRLSMMVGVTDIADAVGMSRQNTRKLMLGYPVPSRRRCMKAAPASGTCWMCLYGWISAITALTRSYWMSPPPPCKSISPVAPVRWCLPWRGSFGRWWGSGVALEGTHVFDSWSGRGSRPRTERRITQCFRTNQFRAVDQTNRLHRSNRRGCRISSGRKILEPLSRHVAVGIVFPAEPFP